MHSMNMTWLSAVVVAVAAGAGHGETAIDFESDAGGGFLVAPVGFNNATALRDDFAALGVRFKGPNSQDGGALLDELSDLGIEARSGNNFIAFDNATNNLADGGSALGPITLIFDPPVTAASIHASGGPIQGVFTIQAFNQGSFVGLGQTLSQPNEYAELAISGPIGGSLDTLRIASSASNVWFLDDLSFTPVGVVIPEPGSAAALGAGLGLIALRRRRRKG